MNENSFGQLVTSTNEYIYFDRFIITRTRNYEDNILDNNEGNNICSSIEQVA